MSEQNPPSQNIEAHQSSERSISQNVFADQKVQVIRQSITNSALLDDRLEVKFPKRESTFFSVTEAEISIYAQLGWISTIFLTLFGTFAGLSLGCVVALLQSSLPANAISTLTLLAWVTGVVAIIFLSSAIVFIIMQSKNKKAWDSVD